MLQTCASHMEALLHFKYHCQHLKMVAGSQNKSQAWGASLVSLVRERDTQLLRYAVGLTIVTQLNNVRLLAVYQLSCQHCKGGTVWELGSYALQ